MHAAVLLAAAVLGVDYGWQPLDDGGLEYIIQIEPELLDSLLAGQVVRSHLPPNLRDVRSYRIQVGRGEVPREGNPPAAVARAPADPPPVREAPPMAAPRDRWFNGGSDAEQPPPARPAAEPRYRDFNFRSETPKPQLPAQESASPPAMADSLPGRFEPEAGSSALVQRTGYGAGDPRATLKGEPEPAEAGPSGAKPPAEPAAKPWLPLTLTLLCLFVSLGGNAYLGLQWWTIRQRCQQLLRNRRGSGPHLAVQPSERNVSQHESEADDEPSDDEDQEVRAISDSELPRGKRRRPG